MTTITTVVLENTSTSPKANVPYTFGWVFAKGHLPSGSAVKLVAPDNSELPCQLDVKNTHNDGSVKHASLTVIVPTMAASASVTYGIAKAASAPTGSAPVPANFVGLNVVATILDTGIDAAGPTAGTLYTADASARLAAGTYRTWRSGPLMAEWILRVPFVNAQGVEHPDAHARFEIMAYKGQALARVHCIFENCWAKPKAVQANYTPWEVASTLPVIYAHTVKVGNTVVDARSVNGFHEARMIGYSNTFGGTGTGIPNDSTLYTASITVDGVVKPISLAGSSIQTFGQVYAAIEAQLGGLATCWSSPGNAGVRITSKTKGVGSKVVINWGSLGTALRNPTVYRPMRGDEFSHMPGRRWMKTFWWGTEPTTHVRHNKQYLISTNAVPNYDPTLTGNAGTIASYLEVVRGPDGDIGRPGIQKQNMPGPGGAIGIGILPAWQVLYFVNQGKDAKELMLRMAALQGSWPCQTREYDTDHPLSLTKWPMATFSPNSGDSKNYLTGLHEKLPSSPLPAHLLSDGNAADIAHHPDFSFLPYLVTGDHCYMESLMFYYTFICLCMNPAYTYRDGAKCLSQAEGQVRGKAWMMRTAVHAGYMVPDDHPKKAEISYMIAQNVSYLNRVFVDPAGPFHSHFGQFGGLIYIGNLGASSFQEEFATMSMGRAVELGYTEFLPLLKYKSRHQVGRLTSGPDFCWQLATDYVLKYRSTSTGPLYSSWKEVFQQTYAARPDILAAPCGSPELGVVLKEGQNVMVGYPDGTEGYPANLQPAVAYCASYNMPGGDNAWLVFDARQRKTDYNYGPQFAIVPRDIPEEVFAIKLNKGGSGLGGAMSTLPSDASFFDRVESNESAVGSVEYRCEYPYNDHSTTTLYNATLWLSQETPSPGTTIEIGLGTSQLNGVEQSVVNEKTAPVGVNFKSAMTKEDAVLLGTLPPKSGRAVWYKRTVLPGTAKLQSDPFVRTIEGMI